MPDEEKVEHISLSEVKNILSKVEKERKELLYEQRIALEHAHKFALLNVTKTKQLIKELKSIEGIEESHAYKIADILPKTIDDIKTIFAKERMNISDKVQKEILALVEKYNI